MTESGLPPILHGMDLDKTSGTTLSGGLTPAVWKVAADGVHQFRYYHRAATANDTNTIWNISFSMEPRPLTGIAWVNTHFVVTPNLLVVDEKMPATSLENTIRRYAQVIVFLNRFFAGKEALLEGLAISWPETDG